MQRLTLRSSDRYARLEFWPRWRMSVLARLSSPASASASSPPLLLAQSPASPPLSNCAALDEEDDEDEDEDDGTSTSMDDALPPFLRFNYTRKEITGG